MSDATLYGDGNPRPATHDELTQLLGDDIAQLWAACQDEDGDQ